MFLSNNIDSAIGMKGGLQRKVRDEESMDHGGTITKAYALMFCDNAI